MKTIKAERITMYLRNAKQKVKILQHICSGNSIQMNP